MYSIFIGDAFLKIVRSFANPLPTQHPTELACPALFIQADI